MRAENRLRVTLPVPVLRATCALALIAVAAPLAAQQPTVPDSATVQRMIEQQFGPGVSQAEVLERLRQSGITRDQLRTRLQQMGYDPTLADQYFNAIQSGGEPPRGQASPQFLQALDRMGVVSPGMAGTAPDLFADSLGLALRLDSLRTDSLLAANDSIDGVLIFGMPLFNHPTTAFEPVLNGPVDPDYRVGPGDELVLILTGNVELAYTLNVSRQGYVVIPDVGQVFVSGLTMDQLRQQLYDRLGQVYSGVQRGPGATTRFDVSLGRMRANLVYIIGEVVSPGSYQISAAATVFNALYRAGGPERTGSFRNVQVRRGGEVVRTIDFYDYLLHGDSRDDIRLEQSDIVFVPPVGARVTIQGAVRREAAYELKEGEGLRDLITFAGGLKADAVVSRIQIDRIVPPEQRRSGVDRVLVDVPLADLVGARPVPLYDGDQVRVFAVSEERRHRLIVTGEVQRPGLYEWSDGMTLWDLVRRADGLREDAYTPRAQIYRLEPQDGTRRLVSTPLFADSAGQPTLDVQLADRDSVVVLSRVELANPQFVDINGFVKNPGTYPLAEGMTVEDLILTAGGFLTGADPTVADIARHAPYLTRTDTTARVFHVPLANDGGNGGTDGGTDGARLAQEAGGGAVPVWVPGPDDFVLQEGDHIFVRRAPGYEAKRTVTLAGEVLRPGTYVLSTRQERLSSILAQAGGPTSEAYLPGMRLVRDSALLGTDLPRALREPHGRYDLILETGDSILLPRYDPSVRVVGAVGFETSVLFEPGRDLDYYIGHAGGYSPDAERNRSAVTYKDGERATVHTFLGIRRSPDVRPGSTIYVPAKPPQERNAGVNWDAILSRTVSLVSLLIALRRL